MSKVVTFLDTNNNILITRNININNADLSIPNNVFNNILFLNNAKIIVSENNTLHGSDLTNSEFVEFVAALESLKQKRKINVCNRVWNGYGKYTNLTNRPCNTNCENIKCDRFENYSKYLKNKQIVGIVELR